MKYSNPRTEAVVEDWPHGRKRVTARFFVETNSRGSRVGRVTTGKPKYTTYHKHMVIVDGDDGRIYPVGVTSSGQVCVWDGTLKTNNYLYNGEDYQGLLSMMTPNEEA